MDTPIEPLDADAVRASLAESTGRLLTGIDILARVDSTNAHLLAAAERDLPSGRVCLAEAQTAGRGQRGRHWYSPPGGNLYLSLLWRYPTAPPRLASLGIATGIAVARVLRSEFAAAIQLKWPNDLIWQQRKLGGLLLETRIGRDCIVVAGIGINLSINEPAARIDQPWVDLATIVGRRADRNHLAAVLLNRLLPLYAHYPDNRQDLSVAWRELDSLAGRWVEIRDRGRICCGIARGIDADGQLRLEDSHGTGGIRAFASGTLSLRART